MTTPTTFRTVSGRLVDVACPRSQDVDINDIAHSLAMQCRYGGHTPRFYSVAEHCVLMSLWVPPEFALAALLHDATEAYVGDVVSPLKYALGGTYGKIEAGWAWAIGLRYGVCIEPLPAQVREADSRIVADERAALMGVQSTSGREPLGVHVTGNQPFSARSRYLARFQELMPNA